MSASPLATMRIDYGHRSFDTADLRRTWHEQLGLWLQEARDQGVTEPNAMVVATADATGEPTSRTVLCKGLGPEGIDFYTGSGSVKSRALEENPRASATFPWYLQSRQVHVRGSVRRVPRDEVQRYWETRPRGSQIGAWASPQSTVVARRDLLDDAHREAEQRFADLSEVPLPPDWGGWRIVPHTVEFWQGRTSRMHDRLRFRDEAGSWSVARLAP